ncbi:hypothetical protein IM40_04920 [Candidatus Paracaedimonas acanthamoebae]|nr:hypothetical protein IM40_04920 [Candidatus Paracaedimonas acanthamoebae]
MSQNFDKKLLLELQLLKKIINIIKNLIIFYYKYLIKMNFFSLYFYIYLLNYCDLILGFQKLRSTG